MDKMSEKEYMTNIISGTNQVKKSGFVALAGSPNAGKSTLLNALMCEKLAIVSPKPQTTRSEIRGIMNYKDAQIIFADTPGIHQPVDRLGSRLNKQTASVLQGVDLIYYLVDGTAPFNEAEERTLRMIRQADLPVFLILNKIDKLNKKQILNKLTAWQNRYPFAEYFPVSALNDHDFADLLDTTIQYLPEGGALYPMDMTSDGSTDFRISEIIREKILLCTEQEVPHATAVIVEEKTWVEDVCAIRALVLVEKQGQKGIIIGKKGAMLQKICALAQKEIKEIFGWENELEIYVRVEEEWRSRDKRITEYGYGITDE